MKTLGWRSIWYRWVKNRWVRMNDKDDTNRTRCPVVTDQGCPLKDTPYKED